MFSRDLQEETEDLGSVDRILPLVFKAHAFGVELDGIDLLFFTADRFNDAIVCPGKNFQSFGQSSDRLMVGRVDGQVFAIEVI